MVSEHLQTFLDKPVKDYVPGEGIDPQQLVYRISIDYGEEQTILEKIDAFAGEANAGEVKELIIGNFATEGYERQDAEGLVEKLVSLKGRLANLKALFIGEATYEESEISWIMQTDLSPVLAAWPALEHLQVRGGENLSFSNLQHDNLKRLIIETGGLPPNVIHEIGGARLPNLEVLILWLGTKNYGFGSRIDDFVPILTGLAFPKLVHLGLMDSEIQDMIAFAVANSPVLEQLKVLDLSMGALSDKGGAALVASPVIRKLEYLNLRHHYLSDGMMAQLQGLGIMLLVIPPTGGSFPFVIQPCSWDINNRWCMRMPIG